MIHLSNFNELDQEQKKKYTRIGLIVFVIIIIIGYFTLNLFRINIIENQYSQTAKGIFNKYNISDVSTSMENIKLDKDTGYHKFTISSNNFQKLSKEDQFKIENAIGNMGNFGAPDFEVFSFIESNGQEYDIYDINTKYYASQDSSTNSDDTTSNSYTDNATEIPDDEKGACWALAEDVVTANLKSPSSAKFPFSYGSDGVSMTKSGDIYTVIAWVDAQNSYGATLRNNFTVTMTKSGYGSDAKFTSNSCVIN